ncbi:MAG: hypothetical protein H7Z76_13245 [Methylotenera sp.]|nr:hypothetical protein [Flavobacterium sp.]
MKNRNLQLKLLSFYQIFGGVLGCGISLWVFISLISIQRKEDILFYTVLSLCSFSLYIYSIFCGSLLLRKSSRIKGLHFSLVNQLMQVVSFSIFGFAFKYISGLYTSIGFDLVKNTLLFKWGLSTWEILFNSNSVISEIHINIFSLLLVFLIDRLLRIFALSDIEEYKIEGAQP